MIESRLLVAKPFAFLSLVLNQSRSRLLYLCLVGRGKLPLIRLLPRLASGKAFDLIQLKSRISAALNMRLRLGDHIVP